MPNEFAHKLEYNLCKC